MAMEATLQVRMDSETKAKVEALYRGLGTSFSEAVRIFARQSLAVGGMPFRPAMKTWEELTEEEVGQKLQDSENAIQNGLVYTQEEADRRMARVFRHG